MKVGLGRVDITPREPVLMAGYADRNGNSQGVRDPLHARSFYFAEGETEVGIVVLDLLGVSEGFLRKVRTEVSRLCILPSQNLLISCTHTHSGPGGLTNSRSGNVDRPGANREYVAGLVEKVSESLQAARRNAFPALCRINSCHLRGIADNREDQGQESGARLWAVAVEDLRRSKLRGVLATFPCHSTVLGADNRLISPDLLGAAASKAEERLGRGVVGIAAGAAGDMSTRFHRREQTFAELDRLSGLLKRNLLRLIQGGGEGAAGLAAGSKKCRLPYKEAPPKREVEDLVSHLRKELERRGESANSGEMRILRTKLEGARILLDMVEQGVFTEASATARLSGISFGDHALVGFPGEPFNAVEKTLSSNFSGSSASVAGLTNGYLGYFPDRRAQAENWYEALASPFGYRATEKLIRESVQLLEQLRKETLQEEK
ncbi:MAG: neutral/alkaline non-lysosomal ceramidase N-terminal domain-containing protein [Candidatus Acetothermia bacterium]